MPGRPGEPNHVTGPAQRPLVLLQEEAHGVALLRRPYSFLAIRSFIAALSRASSAYIRLSLAFSASSSFTRRSSDASMPPYFDFFIQPPGGEKMPESSTYWVSTDRRSLRSEHGIRGVMDLRGDLRLSQLQLEQGLLQLDMGEHK